MTFLLEKQTTMDDELVNEQASRPREGDARSAAVAAVGRSSSPELSWMVGEAPAVSQRGARHPGRNRRCRPLRPRKNARGLVRARVGVDCCYYGTTAVLPQV
ncbi:hypothetical protein WME94_45735 [Sorangium sp. So ce429]